MSENINKKAFEQAEKELLEEKVKHVKDYILTTLRTIEVKKKEKAKVEEELRVLKLNIEDLRNGRFDKLEERITKSKVAHDVTPVIPNFFGVSNHLLGTLSTSISSDWMNLTSGTYNVGNGTIYLSN